MIKPRLVVVLVTSVEPAVIATCRFCVMKYNVIVWCAATLNNGASNDVADIQAITSPCLR
jgi:hypothetical protein